LIPFFRRIRIQVWDQRFPQTKETNMTISLRAKLGGRVFAALSMGVFAFLPLTVTATSFPGVGNGDQYCSPVFAGPTVCHVNEGQGDSLVEMVINATNVPIFINSITAGPISYVAGDRTDIMTGTTIGADGCTGNTLAASGGSCFFTQSFATGTPNDPDDNLIIRNDGESALFFKLTFQPPANLNLVQWPCGNNGQQVLVGGPCNTVLNLDGRTYTATIQSADVFVSDAPEPATLLLIGTALVAGSLKRKRG
jgi:hypothetical protein